VTPTPPASTPLSAADVSSQRTSTHHARSSKRATGFFLGLLLAATAAAFLITQNLKQQKSPIYATKVTKLFSPVCRCQTNSAQIRFRLRHADQLTVTIIDTHGRAARTLIRNQAVRPGPIHLRWNGKLNNGRQAPDSVYHVLADLTDADRSITLVANPIQLDTQPPRIRITRTLLRPHVLELRYRLSKPAHALLYVAQQRIVYTRRQPLTGTITLIFSALSPRHLIGPLFLAAEDAAGNHSPPQPTNVKLTTDGWARTPE
jgi:hypothetical protein